MANGEFLKLQVTYVKRICKLGQGAACCSYLVCGKQFECAKSTVLEETIESRRANGKMIAMGDNCQGPKDTKSEVIYDA